MVILVVSSASALVLCAAGCWVWRRRRARRAPPSSHGPDSDTTSVAVAVTEPTTQASGPDPDERSTENLSGQSCHGPVPGGSAHCGDEQLELGARDARPASHGPLTSTGPDIATTSLAAAVTEPTTQALAENEEEDTDGHGPLPELPEMCGDDLLETGSITSAGSSVMFQDLRHRYKKGSKEEKRKILEEARKLADDRVGTAATEKCLEMLKHAIYREKEPGRVPLACAALEHIADLATNTWKAGPLCRKAAEEVLLACMVEDDAKDVMIRATVLAGRLLKSRHFQVRERAFTAMLQHLKALVDGRARAPDEGARSELEEQIKALLETFKEASGTDPLWQERKKQIKDAVLAAVFGAAKEVAGEAVDAAESLLQPWLPQPLQEWLQG